MARSLGLQQRPNTFAQTNLLPHFSLATKRRTIHSGLPTTRAELRIDPADSSINSKRLSGTNPARLPPRSGPLLNEPTRLRLAARGVPNRSGWARLAKHEVLHGDGVLVLPRRVADARPRRVVPGLPDGVG